MSKNHLVAGNWKMHGNRAQAVKLSEEILAGAQDLSNVDILLCPPFTYLTVVADILKEGEKLGVHNIKLGAQDLSIAEPGAHTGDIAAQMLLDSGCQYVLVGHSERRITHSESDRTLALKLTQAFTAGLKPIFCIGEQLHHRQRGETKRVLKEQIESVAALLQHDLFSKSIIAYEPVWAIGSGQAATPEIADETHAVIRQIVAAITTEDTAQNTHILYGGSVNAENAVSIFAAKNINGGLVGGASLQAESFLAICRAASGSEN